MASSVAYQLYQPGFAQSMQEPETRGKARTRLGFKPTEQQRLTAVGRLEGKLKRYDLATYHTGIFMPRFDDDDMRDDALSRVAAGLVPAIFSRGNELGRDRYEVKTTLYYALKRGVGDGKFELAIHEGEVLVVLKGWKAAHKRTYRNRPHGGRARKAA